MCKELCKTKEAITRLSISIKRHHNCCWMILHSYQCQAVADSKRSDLSGRRWGRRRYNGRAEKSYSTASHTSPPSPSRPARSGSWSSRVRLFAASNGHDQCCVHDDWSVASNRQVVWIVGIDLECARLVFCMWWCPSTARSWRRRRPLTRTWFWHSRNCCFKGWWDVIMRGLIYYCFIIVTVI